MTLDDMRTGTWLAYGMAVKPAATQQSHSSEGIGKPLTLSTFSGYFSRQLPELVKTISHTDLGIPLREVEAFKLATRNAIMDEAWDEVGRYFDFVDSVLESADVGLHDVLGITYLCALFYGETSHSFAEARVRLPKRMAIALDIMERHYEDSALERRH